MEGVFVRSASRGLRGGEVQSPFVGKVSDDLEDREIREEAIERMSNLRPSKEKLRGGQPRTLGLFTQQGIYNPKASSVGLDMVSALRPATRTTGGPGRLVHLYGHRGARHGPGDSATRRGTR